MKLDLRYNPFPKKDSNRQIDQAAMDALLQDKMPQIIELIEAIAKGDPEADIKLAALLDGEPDVVRLAIIDKLREMLKEKAQEKESELDKIIDAQKKQEVIRQRNVFTQWLVWLMSEETLRKIREVFSLRPRVESQVHNIGEELAANGVLTQMKLQDKRDLGALRAAATPAVQPQQGQTKDSGKTR